MTSMYSTSRVQYNPWTIQSMYNTIHLQYNPCTIQSMHNTIHLQQQCMAIAYFNTGFVNAEALQTLLHNILMSHYALWLSVFVLHIAILSHIHVCDTPPYKFHPTLLDATAFAIIHYLCQRQWQLE
uniref:Uncharacterized protein n=1 Tax=Glossina brevipalpis TaxID=37001 RepID=A0A1A9W4Z7_9MUSC